MTGVPVDWRVVCANRDASFATFWTWIWNRSCKPDSAQWWLALCRACPYDRGVFAGPAAAAPICFERPSMTVRFLSSILLALTLAACATNPLEVTVSRCPAVAIVGDTGTLTRFDGDGRATENVLFTASISDVEVNCNEGDSVASVISFYIGAQSEGRITNETITLPYFVAVLKDNSEVVTKRIFDVALRFDGNGYAVSREVLSQYIPTIDQARRYNYELLIGFQLGIEDVAFNMER